MDGWWIRIAVAVLATWRISAMLWYEHGQLMVWDRVRAFVGRQGEFWADLVECFWCVTLWVSLPVALVAWLWWYALIPFALSGAAILLSGGGRIIWREVVDDGES